MVAIQIDPLEKKESEKELPSNGIVAQPRTNKSFCHKVKNAVTIFIVYFLCLIASTYWYLNTDYIVLHGAAPLDWLLDNCILNKHTPHNNPYVGDWRPCDDETKQIIFKHVYNHLLINIIPTTTFMIVMFAFFKMTSKVAPFQFPISFKKDGKKIHFNTNCHGFMQFCGKWLTHLVFLTLLYIPVFLIGYDLFSYLNGDGHVSLKDAISQFMDPESSPTHFRHPLCYLMFCAASNVITIFLVFVLPNLGFPWKT